MIVKEQGQHKLLRTKRTKKQSSIYKGFQCIFGRWKAEQRYQWRVIQFTQEPPEALEFELGWETSIKSLRVHRAVGLQMTSQARTASAKPRNQRREDDMGSVSEGLWHRGAHTEDLLWRESSAERLRGTIQIRARETDHEKGFQKTRGKMPSHMFESWRKSH